MLHLPLPLPEKAADKLSPNEKTFGTASVLLMTLQQAKTAVLGQAR